MTTDISLLKKINMQNKKRSTLKNSLTALLILALVFAASACKKEKSALRNYNFGGNFTLTDQYGKEFELASLRGKVVLLLFGYTNCPDVCPLILSKIAKVYDNLDESPQKNLVTVFIGVDTKRDTPERLKDYLNYFAFKPVGLTGTENKLKMIAKQYVAIFAVRDTGSKSGYQVDHTAKTYLIDREGRVRYLFSHMDDADRFTSVTEELLEETTGD